MLFRSLVMLQEDVHFLQTGRCRCLLPLPVGDPVAIDGGNDIFAIYPAESQCGLAGAFYVVLIDYAGCFGGDPEAATVGFPY